MSRLSILVLCVMACLVQMALSQNCGCNQIYSNQYGGSGTGQVGVSGNIGASGNTCVVGSVPVLGAVDFGGKVAAAGSVSISGQCGCGCGCN
ncbi:chorion class CA protein ERA.1-like [Leguminivora glycinivorella]|uniref:chorion class CA protein ERA.1-like n=1 Tax=Leguminivora glycinivorella TaxID=1035111 RepID=UPI002010BC3C|nr:chorion class CA protein ERA.1-like [Leguminivora glycinivorella]